MRKLIAGLLSPSLFAGAQISFVQVTNCASPVQAAGVRACL
jgi:hypothetical protein